jgi:hypothetical protein
VARAFCAQASNGALLADINRVRRVLWVLVRYEPFFLPKVGGRMPVRMLNREVEGEFRITSVGEGFVIACRKSDSTNFVRMFVQQPRPPLIRERKSGAKPLGKSKSPRLLVTFFVWATQLARELVPLRRLYWALVSAVYFPHYFFRGHS